MTQVLTHASNFCYNKPPSLHSNFGILIGKAKYLTPTLSQNESTLTISNKDKEYLLKRIVAFTCHHTSMNSQALQKLKSHNLNSQYYSSKEYSLSSIKKKHKPKTTKTSIKKRDLQNDL